MKYTWHNLRLTYGYSITLFFIVLEGGPHYPTIIVDYDYSFHGAFDSVDCLLHYLCHQDV